MKYSEGDILKRKNRHPKVQDIAIVVDAADSDDTVELLQFDDDGPFTARLTENHADDLFEVDNG